MSEPNTSAPPPVIDAMQEKIAQEIAEKFYASGQRYAARGSVFIKRPGAEQLDEAKKIVQQSVPVETKKTKTTDRRIERLGILRYAALLLFAGGATAPEVAAELKFEEGFTKHLLTDEAFAKQLREWRGKGIGWQSAQFLTMGFRLALIKKAKLLRSGDDKIANSASDTFINKTMGDSTAQLFDEKLEFKDRTTEELEYYVKHGKFPETNGSGASFASAKN